MGHSCFDSALAVGLALTRNFCLWFQNLHSDRFSHFQEHTSVILGDADSA
jgi:hypothetical protein